MQKSNQLINIKYETIKNRYISKEQAIAIANCDRNLKDSLFEKLKNEDNLYLDWISFRAFDVGLVQLSGNFAWHVKVKSGSWGATKIFNIPFLGIKIGYKNYDGEFNEKSGVSCFIMCDSGEYYFHDEIDIKQVKAPNMKEYKEYIKTKSIYYS